MLRITFSIFLMLHGLVHFWYFLLAGKYVKFIPEMGWTGQSWLLGDPASVSWLKWFALSLYTVSAAFFIVSGIGLMFNKIWYMHWLLISAVISSMSIILFFDGKFDMLVQKGLIGLIINFALIVYIMIRKGGAL